MRFSDKYIDSLKPKEKIVDIREGNGFGIRVTPGGVKTWFFIYRFDGKRRFLNLGHYPAVSLANARVKHRDALKVVEAGKDPLALARDQQEERRKAPTVADLVNEYLEKHAKVNKKSWAEDQRCLEKEVITLWGDRKAKDVTKRDVVLLLEGIVKRGSPVMANNTLEKIRKMFNFAVERDILEHTPCYGVKKPTKKEHKDRVLTEAEIITVWKGLDGAAMSDEIRRVLKLILVTAQRPGEVIGMHSSEINGQWWTVPAERAKNGKAHRVFLTQTALQLIGPSDGYIFKSPRKVTLPSGEKIAQSMDVNAVAYAVRRNFEEQKIEEEKNRLDERPLRESKKLVMPSWTPHDLRRTAATNLSAIGFSDETIDAILNHAKKGVVAIYNRHRYDKEKQTALEAWERRLTTIVSGSMARNVVPLTTQMKRRQLR